MRMGKDLIKMIRSSCVEPGTNGKRRNDLNSKKYLKGNPTLCKKIICMKAEKWEIQKVWNKLEFNDNIDSWMC